MGSASSLVINTKHGLQEGFSLSQQITAVSMALAVKRSGANSYKKKECMNNVDSYPIPYKKEVEQN